MTDLTDRITEVQLAHRVRVGPHSFVCSCGDWSVQAEDGEEQGCRHVAQQIAEALQLAEVWTPVSVYAPSEPMWTDYYDDRKEAEKAVGIDGGQLGHSWMTPWSAVEDKP